MPIHDWKPVLPGIFHDFHVEWITTIKRALNRLLPSEYYALAEQATGGFIPDVLTLHRPTNGSPISNGTPKSSPPTSNGGGVALATAPPTVAIRQKSEHEIYNRKTKTVTVRHTSDHHVVAVVEIVSNGNKRSRAEFVRFVKMSVELIERGIHVMAIDLFPPGPRDPEGIHGEIWQQITGAEFVLPDDKPLTVVSYCADLVPEAFVEPTAVGKALIDMPLFYDVDYYIPVPLETTYMQAWDSMPEYWREQIEAMK